MLSFSNTGGMMATHTNPPRIHITRGWPRRVKSAMLHVIALAQYASGPVDAAVPRNGTPGFGPLGLQRRTCYLA